MSSSAVSLTAIGCTSLALLAFVGTRAILPRARVAGETTLTAAKLEELRGLADEVDVVFLGNSRAYRHADTETFDRRTRSAGRPHTSYNLGAPNMSFPELDWLVRQVLALDDLALEWIAIDLSFPWQADARNFTTRRVEAWHDTRALGIALDFALRSDDPDRLGLPGAIDHVRHFLRRQVGLGERAALASASGTSPLRGHVRGFEALLPDESPAHDERRAAFVAARADYEREVQATRETLRRRVPLDPVHAAALERLLADIRAAGVHVLTYLPPMPRPLTWLAIDGSGAPGDLHLELNDPERHGELFAIEHRYDADHLGARGARVFSRTLADALVEHERASLAGRPRDP